MIKEIGRFLTKHQSDYRRYYTANIERESENFVSFKEIQNRYLQVSEMKRDFHELNTNMQIYADFLILIRINGTIGIEMTNYQ